MEVVKEYPSEVEHIYSPSCVPLVRCAGCCGDENLECHPTHTTNVTMQVRKRLGLRAPADTVRTVFASVDNLTSFYPSAVKNQAIRTGSGIC